MLPQIAAGPSAALSDGDAVAGSSLAGVFVRWFCHVSRKAGDRRPFSWPTGRLKKTADAARAE
jgi:hypothetical protein